MKNSFLSVFMLMIAVCMNDSNAQSTVDSTDNPYYKMGGDIQLKEIRKNGNLFILLVTEETFKTPLNSYKKLIHTISDKEIKEKKVSFEFTNIPPGKYGIRCFIDEDGNEELNKGMFGPSEPWGMSWQGKRSFGWPKFKHIAFDLNRNLMDIRIVVE